MVTRHGRSRPFARPRCDELEPRETPAAVTVVDYAGGFTGGDEFRGLPTPSTSDDLVLTDGPFQARAVWVPDRVHVGAFETSFVFRQEGEPGRLGDGFTFALTGNVWQSGAVGSGLGYQGITDSVAVKFDLVDNAGEGGHSVGVFTGGAEPTVPAVRLDDSPIHLHAQHPIRADLAYDGAVLTVTLTDTVLPDHAWAHQFVVDIPAAVGGPTAYAGFTAGTGELFARQAIDSWTYAEVVPDVPTGRPPEIAPLEVHWFAPGTVALAARVTDDRGADHLTYAWEVVSAPDGQTRRLPPWQDLGPGRPQVVASETMGYGPYTFRLTARDAEGQTAVREVTYDFGVFVKRLEVSPATATAPAGGSAQFSVTEYDRAGAVIPNPLTPTWHVVNGPGTIDETGRYTAPAGATGPATVEAVLTQPDDRGMNIRLVGGRAAVEVVPAGPVITRVSAVYETDTVLSANTVVLRATATDAGGTGALTYTWELASATNGYSAQVSPSAADPSSALAYLTGPAVYTFRVTVRDAAGRSATDQVAFTHDPRYIASLELTPQSATVPAGGTVQITPVVRDQYGQVMPGIRPTLYVVGPGTIDPSGLYTAPTDVSGSVSINAMMVVGPARLPRTLDASASVTILSSRPPDPGLDFGGGFAGADLVRNGSAEIVGDRLRLADGRFQAGSAVAPTPIDVRRFAARFEFRVGDTADGRLGDGLALVFQNAGPTALGAAGEGLGYAGIGKSVALKFDLVDNAGEGAESVGVFTNGADPTVPALPLAGGFFSLHSGHVLRADLTYAGGYLNYMVWDTATGSGTGGSLAVDIPAAVGGPTAFAGFTAGTGELFAPIDVLSWKYVPTDNWNPVPFPS